MVKLDHTPPGVPHACHILPKYEVHIDEQSEMRLLKDHTQENFLLTFDGCGQKNEEKLAAGEKAKAINFQSCENKPLLTGGCVIDTLSTTPLYISLGLGLKNLNIVENETIRLDSEIKSAEGQYDGFSEAFERKKEILAACKEINEKIEKVEEKVNHVKERKKEIIKERAAFFKKDKRGRFVNNSDVAAGVRERNWTQRKPA